MNLGLLKSRIIYDYKPFIGIRMKKFYKEFIQPGDLCFDIGAHTGNRTRIWQKMGARVIAVEPQPVLYEFMRKRFDRNPSVKILQIAVGKQLSSAVLNISSRHPTLSTLSDNWMEIISRFQNGVKFDKQVTVKVLTFDSLIEKYGVPAFCKIDVEGFEEEVLLGLTTPLPALSFEFFPTTMNQATRCLNLIKKMGKYRYNWSFRESFVYNNPKWVDESEMEEIIKGYKGFKSGDIYAKMI